MEEKIIIDPTLGSFSFCSEGEDRWVRLPKHLVLKSDTDVEHLDEITSQAYSFLIGDMDLEEIDG